MLAGFSILFVVGACVYWAASGHLSGVSIQVFEISLVAMLLGPAAIFVVWLAALGGGTSAVLEPTTDQRVLLTSARPDDYEHVREPPLFTVSSGSGDA